MKNLESRLKSLLAEYDFHETKEMEIADKNFFGTKKIPAVEFRDQNKALVQSSGIRQFYLSSLMYKDRPDMESFRYMIIWTRAKIRPFRCKSFSDYELDKVFISGKTDEILIEKLQHEIECGNI